MGRGELRIERGKLKVENLGRLRSSTTLTDHSSAMLTDRDINYKIR